MKLDPESETYKKVERFLNPETVEDYGLCVSEAEMREHPDTRQLLASMKRSRKYFHKYFGIIGDNMIKTLDRVREEVLKGVKK